MVFCSVPQACLKRNPWNRGSVNRIPLHRSYCYLLFISVTTTLFCEMVNPQNVRTTQTGFHRLYMIFTYTGYTHSTHNLPIPPCFHSKKPLSTDWFRKFPPTWDAFRYITPISAREPMMRTWPCAVAFWNWWIPCHRHQTSTWKLQRWWQFFGVLDQSEISVLLMYPNSGSKFQFQSLLIAYLLRKCQCWLCGSCSVQGHEGVFP